MHRTLLPLIACAIAALATSHVHSDHSEPPQPPKPNTAIASTLDDFHDAAAHADFDRYFAHFSPEAVFLGTDATERWPVKEFAAFAKPYFDAGTGWAYTARQRNITILPDQATAFFDEILHNDKYGTCRGTGVLRKINNTWRICQYNLSFPVPNDVAAPIVSIIKKHEATTVPDQTQTR